MVTSWNTTCSQQETCRVSQPVSYKFDSLIGHRFKGSVSSGEGLLVSYKVPICFLQVSLHKKFWTAPLAETVNGAVLAAWQEVLLLADQF